jgi:4-carboxymuconolactone decarboxylase
MRIFQFCVSVAGLAGLALAQAPAPGGPEPPKFTLAGDRFKPLTWDEMTPEQKTMIEHLLAGDRKGVGGPFNILLRSPEMGDLAQQFGGSMRFHSLPLKRVRHHHHRPLLDGAV